MKKLSIIFLFCSLFASDLVKEAEPVPDFFSEEASKEFNEKVLQLKKELKDTYLVGSLKDEENVKKRLEKIRTLKNEITSLERDWKKERIDELKDEEFVFWDQGQTTIADLVMEYGSSDFLYVIPPEIGKLKITLHSQIPLPYESWDEMIKLILSQNGIGIKEVSPFCKQLYTFRLDLGQVEAVVRSKEHLQLIDDVSRIFYVFFSPCRTNEVCPFFL